MTITNHIVSQIHKSKPRSENTLYVIGVITNPVRFHSRYRLFRKWYEEMLRTPNVQPCVVELAFADREFEVTDHNNPWHLQLRAHQEIWHKEDLINVAARELLPFKWKYMAWVDCDISFEDPGWAQETIQQLQHFHVVQPWSDAIDLGPNGEIIDRFRSFAYAHQQGILAMPQKVTNPYVFGHPGYAWACDRYFWENTRGLMDHCILGSADHSMAWAMLGKVEMTYPSHIAESYKRRCLEWQTRVIKTTHAQDVGYVSTFIKHAFHGSKKNRKYVDRWQILLRNKYDPDKHLAYDHQGVTKIIGNPKLVSDIHKYFLQRCEDSIDV